jgi:peptidoglycan/xylan/chitin deacetylase (PgdA/CDA1 family)
MRVISLGYHDVAGGAQPALAARRDPIYTLDRHAFVDQLDIIRKTEPPAPLFLTFDDGALCSASCIAGELERRRLRGLFFIVTAWIGSAGFLDERQIRRLHDSGHIIGSHSHTHPERMSHLPWNGLQDEWGESSRILNRIIGEPVRFASVAGGYYSQKVAASAAAAGYRFLFTSEPTAAVNCIDGCIVMGRYSIRRSTPTRTVGAIVRGERLPRYCQAVAWLAKKSAKCIAGPLFLDLRRAMISRSIPF